MKVAVLFSGGKDSVMAVHYAMQQGWDIEALIAVKPKNTEAYLWHYSTVEWTLLSAQAMGLPLFLLKNDEIGPEKEANVLQQVFSRLKINALLLGGVGLQKTQIESVKKLAAKYKIQVLVPYETYSSEQLLREELKAGFDIRITNVAVDGLGPEWLGKKLDGNSALQMKMLSEKHGFNILGEGGHYDSFVVDGTIFKQKIEFLDTKKVWDSKTSSGYLEVTNAELVEKE
jgi:predicted ATP pyrophosphatase (TIGR00289 family)